LADWKRYATELQNNLQEKLSVIDRQQAICDRLPARLIIEQELARVRKQIETIDAELAQLRAKLDQLEQEVINGAKAIFCTLTKNYVGESLKGQQFTAVIVDEISMALPPLIFLAAAPASTRVILVGDFKQLPPIVRSKGKIAKERLEKDVFQLADLVTDDLKPVQSVQVLTMLKTQQRMRPEIANVARKLAYRMNLIDSDKVKTRPTPDWLQVLCR
jgi:superfamily I DNA and/or RNA helicase